MKQYKVFTHPSGTHEAVKQGWSWPGFFFCGFWALFKKMWGVAAALMIGGFALGFVIGLIMPIDTANIVVNVILLVVAFVVGANGNQWRESNLLSRGYQTASELVEDSNPDGAIANFLGNETSVTA